MKLSLAILILAAGFLSACAAPQPRGYIRLGGWPLPGGKVQGYNIYIAEQGAKKYEKANDKPIIGKTIEINQLKAGKGYYLYFTPVSTDNPPREGRPGKTFKRVAKVRETPAP
jgi:hypothetical protein